MWAIDNCAIANEDPGRLALPRILCLHGGGTNARIFRAQCRLLEAMLKPHFRFCYAEAPFLSQAGPDVQTVYNDFGPFRAWLRWNPDNAVGESDGVSEEIMAAINAAVKRDNACGASGDWAGILGFSQGAKIAASILLAQQHQVQVPKREQLAPPWRRFRFGVLLAGRGPTIHLPITTDTNSSDIDYGRLAIPTIHVHGQSDANLHLHRKLLQDLCLDNSTSVIEWNGAHRVPLITAVVSRIADEMLATLHHTAKD